MATFNYDLGVFVDDASALASIVLKGWDSGGSPIQGMFYFDSTLNRIKNWDGSAWRVVDYKGGMITAGSSGCDYTTIEEALAASALLPYSAVAVYPGVHPINNPLTIPQNSTLIWVGGPNTGYADCQNPNEHAFVHSAESGCFGLEVRNVIGAGYAAFHFPAGASKSENRDCGIWDCDTGWLSDAGASRILVTTPRIFGGTCGTVFKASNAGKLNINRVVVHGTVIADQLLEVDGVDSTLVIQNGRVGGNNTTRIGTLKNNGILEMQVVHATGCSEGFFVEATGGLLQLGAVQITNTAGDHLNLANAAGAQCIVNGGYLDDDKFVIGAAASIEGNYYSASLTRPGPTTIGEAWNGITVAEQLPMASFMRATASTGWDSGGGITDGGVLDVDVALGTGYVNTGTGVVSVEWANTTITVPDDADFWIYVGADGVVASQPAEPNSETKIILGNGIAMGGDVVLLSSFRIQLEHLLSERHEYIHKVMGSIYDAGFAADKAVPGTQKLNVAGGTYYQQQRHKTATGGSPITFTTWYNGAAGWVATPGVTDIPSDNYNSFGVGLAAIPGGHYAKHQLWVCEADGVTQFHLVYAQTEHALIGDAEDAAAPTPPGLFPTAGVPLYGPVMLSAAGAIASLVDDRPAITTGGSAGAAPAPATHGAMAGLLVDDHTQYALLAGDAARNPVTGEVDFTAGVLTVPTAATPTQTKEGSLVWDSDDDLLTVGDGVARKVLVDETKAQTLANKTLSVPTIADLSNAGHDHSNAANGGLGAQATTTLRGVTELATQVEVDAGADTQRIVTPNTLANYSGLTNANITVGAVAPVDTSGQTLWLHTGVPYNGMLFFYDTTRLKWLSVESIPWYFGEDYADGANLCPAAGINSGADSFYQMARNMTITGYDAVIRTGQLDKGFEIWVNGIAVVSFNLVAGSAADMTVDEDLVVGDKLAAFAVVTGSAVRDVVMPVWGRWRAS